MAAARAAASSVSSSAAREATVARRSGRREAHHALNQAAYPQHCSRDGEALFHGEALFTAKHFLPFLVDLLSPE